MTPQKDLYGNLIKVRRIRKSSGQTWESRYGFVTACRMRIKARKRMMGKRYGLGYRHTPEEIKKISEAGKQPCPTEVKRKISESEKGKFVSKETRIKNREHLLNMIKNNKFPKFGSSIENKFEREFLIAFNLKYRKQYILGKYVFDFVLVKDRILFEIQGDYWHNLHSMKVRDIYKKRFAEKRGWKVIPIWQHTLNDNYIDISVMMKEGIHYGW